MKKSLIVVLTFACALALTVPALGQDMTGNGLDVNGKHYNLNILGKEADHCPGADKDNSNGHTIFVWLNTSIGDLNGKFINAINHNNLIFLQEGPFAVIDGNACKDSGGAIFQLPCDNAEVTYTRPEGCDTTYTIWVRGLGKPGDNVYATITTCEYLKSTGEIFCSTAPPVTVSRTGKKSTFTNVTKQLTTLLVGGVTSGIFDNNLMGYFWEYDNNGLRNCQLRFYMVDGS